MPFGFTSNYQEQTKSFLAKNIPAVLAIGIIFLLLASFVGLAYFEIREIERNIASRVLISLSNTPEKRIDESAIRTSKKPFLPGNFSMETIKKKGCVADGMLSGYGGNTKEMIALIERSDCQYLHRALETWLEPPDFEKSAEIMAKINKPGLVFGMFIAEAVDRKENYFDPVMVKNFDFSDMCREETKNTWGEHTCIPSFENSEYRDYIKSITQRAMDIGVQSFLFGQIYFQDEEKLSKSELPDIIKDMRNYAKKKGLQIAIGAQTNSIADEKYLQLFDYIEGGTGIDSEGKIEGGPCWSQKTSCWALLWNDQFRTKAKNVLLHLDWSGIENDDMSVFARMDQAKRIRTLDNLYTYFTSRDMGFLMPFLAPLYPENKGCYGPKKSFYSPDNRYKCRDEDAVNKILTSY